MNNDSNFKVVDYIEDSIVETDFAELAIDYASEILLGNSKQSNINNPKNFLEKIKAFVIELGRKNRYTIAVSEDFKKMAYNQYEDIKLFYLFDNDKIIGFQQCFLEKISNHPLIGNIGYTFIKDEYNKDKERLKIKLLKSAEKWLVNQGISVVKIKFEEAELEKLDYWYIGGYDNEVIKHNGEIIMTKIINKKDYKDKQFIK